MPFQIQPTSECVDWLDEGVQFMGSCEVSERKASLPFV